MKTENQISMSNFHILHTKDSRNILSKSEWEKKVCEERLSELKYAINNNFEVDDATFMSWVKEMNMLVNHRYKEENKY